MTTIVPAPRSAPHLPDGCARALLAHLRRASGRNFERPVVELSLARIAEAIEYHVRTVQSAALKLHADGHLHYTPGRWTPDSRYRRSEDVPDRYELPPIIVPTPHPAASKRRSRKATAS